jgi:ABC-type sulfate transport system permease subunit
LQQPLPYRRCLTILALVTLVIKKLVERKTHQQLKAGQAAANV